MSNNQNPKSKTLNSKKDQSTQAQSPKQYDLEERTLNSAKHVRIFIKSIPKTLANNEDARQVIKSSGSVGANYIEASEALSKKDFAMRIKIARKEAKESRYWLRLIEDREDHRDDKVKLIQEAFELTKIFGSIVEKVE